MTEDTKPAAAHNESVPDETPEQIAERFDRSLEWAREHRGVHRCVDNKIYRVSCLVTDPTCDRVARSYLTIAEAAASCPDSR